MNVEEMNKIRKLQGLSIDELSKKAGLPKSTVEKVLFGVVKHPRIDTMQAIERALEIDEEKPTSKKTTTPATADEYSDEEKRLVGAYRVLPEGKRLFLLEMIEKFAAEEQSGHGNKWNRG